MAKTKATGKKGTSPSKPKKEASRTKSNEQGAKSPKRGSSVPKNQQATSKASSPGKSKHRRTASPDSTIGTEMISTPSTTASTSTRSSTSSPSPTKVAKRLKLDDLTLNDKSKENTKTKKVARQNKKKNGAVVPEAHQIEWTNEASVSKACDRSPHFPNNETEGKTFPEKTSMLLNSFPPNELKPVYLSIQVKNGVKPENVTFKALSNKKSLVKAIVGAIMVNKNLNTKVDGSGKAPK